VVIAALRALGKVFAVKEAFRKVLDEGGVALLVDLLDHQANATEPLVGELAAETLALISFFAAGKRAVVSGEAVPKLIRMLSLSDGVGCQVSSSSALLTLSAEAVARKVMLEEGIVDVIAEGLNRCIVDLRLQGCGVASNLVRTIVNLGDDTAGRPFCRSLVPTLEELSALESLPPLVRSSAKKAIHICTSVS